MQCMLQSHILASQSVSLCLYRALTEPPADYECVLCIITRMLVMLKHHRTVFNRLKFDCCNNGVKRFFLVVDIILVELAVAWEKLRVFTLSLIGIQNMSAKSSRSLSSSSQLNFVSCWNFPQCLLWWQLTLAFHICTLKLMQSVKHTGHQSYCLFYLISLSSGRISTPQRSTRKMLPIDGVIRVLR